MSDLAGLAAWENADSKENKAPMAEYREQVEEIQAKMREQQRVILREAFASWTEEQRAEFAEALHIAAEGEEPILDALVRQHGSGGEYAVLERSDGKNATLVWVPYESNPNFGLLRIIDP